jgi:fatty-acyl-CoA synthase
MRAASREAGARAPLTTAHWPKDESLTIVPWTVGDVLREAAGEAGSAPALVAAAAGREPRRWTFRQLLDESERAAASLLARFRPGQRIAIWAPNCPEWLFVQFGAALAGMPVVPVNPAVGGSELKRVLGQTRAAGVFLARDRGQIGQLETVRPRLPGLKEVTFLEDWAEVVAAAGPRGLPAVDSGDPLRVQYTLGTTGPPKPVLLHHRAWTNNARFIAAALRATAGEAWLNPLPYFHVSGFGPSTLAALQARATQVLCPYDADVILELLQSERAALLSVPPTMLTTLLDHPQLCRRDVSSLRVVSCGGMSFDPELARRVGDRLGARFTMASGQTECCGITHKIRSDDDVEGKAGTVGRPLPQVESRVIDADGRTVAVGETGEICVRADQVMIRYLDMPEATAARLDPEGWLHTGDLGSVDADGYFRLAGRREELIRRAGELVFPREIEEVLLGHPAVADAAVVGVPAGARGDEDAIAAFVVPRSGRPADAELAAYCADRLPSSRVPTHWAQMDRLPLTPLGKVQKHVLRQRLAPASAGREVLTR